jgi:hypothetical protein
MTSSQGRQWVVGYGRYHIISDSLTQKSQETILTPRTTRSMVKIMKQEHEVNNTRPLSLVKPFSSDFIELSDSSSNDNLTPHFLSMILPNLISQSSSL